MTGPHVRASPSPLVGISGCVVGPNISRLRYRCPAWHRCGGPLAHDQRVRANLVTLSWRIVIVGAPGGLFATLLYGFDPFNVQNTSRRGGARRRGSLEHLGRLEEEGWGNGDPKGLGRLQVDHQRACGGLLDRQIGGVGAVEELPHGGSGAPELLRQAHPLCREAAGLQKLPTRRS
jgi:hypothetical protein